MRRLPWVLLTFACACGGGDDDESGTGRSCETPGPACCGTGAPLASGADAIHDRLHGRWELCGGSSLPAGADGIEFRDGAYWQFLVRDETSGALVGDSRAAGWEIGVSDGACGDRLTLGKQDGGYVVADARIYPGGKLRLDFEADGQIVTACYVSVR